VQQSPGSGVSFFGLFATGEFSISFMTISFFIKRLLVSLSYVLFHPYDLWNEPDRPIPSLVDPYVLVPRMFLLVSM
jgi:hypothetical protein